MSTLYLDIENADQRLLVAGYAFDEGDVLYHDAYSMGQEPDLLDALADPEVLKVTQSGHDLRFYLRRGATLAGPWANTMVMAWCLDENQPLDQEHLTKKYLGPEHWKQNRITQRANRVYFDRLYALDEWDAWPASVKFAFRMYNQTDVRTLRELYKELGRQLNGTDFLDYWEHEEVPFSSVLLRMEARGLPVNLADTEVLAEEVRAQRDLAAQHLRVEAKLPEHFNLNSPPQVRQYLFTKGTFRVRAALPKAEAYPEGFYVEKEARLYAHGYYVVPGRGLEPTPPPKKKANEKPSTEPSTSSPALLFKHPHDEWVRELCLSYRKSSKLLGTYLEKFPRIAVGEDVGTGGTTVAPRPNLPRIYGRFNQTGTVTGRLSSSDPNLQNIPRRGEMGKRTRALFQGNFVIGDYDSLEMRIMAHFSGDRRLVKVFADDEDPHLLTAKAIFGGDYDHDSPERDMAKTINYAVGYQSGPKTLAQTMTLNGYPTSFGEAKGYMTELRRFYYTLFRWMDNEMYLARQAGGVNTIGGRRRRLGTGFKSATWGEQKYAERQAVNTKVQGSAADILRRVMLVVDQRFPDLPMLAQVHDELILEWSGRRPNRETLASLQLIAERGHGFELRVPLRFVPAVVSTWADKGQEVDDEASALAN